MVASLLSVISNFASADDMKANEQDFGVKAGIVLSINEDFLNNGQNELLSEFVKTMNRVGQSAEAQLDLSKYLPEGDGSGLKLNLSHMRITETGNLLTSAPKTVDIQAECACIQGTIGPVERLELLFDYEFDQEYDEDQIAGTATISLYDFAASYTLTPEVVNIDESFSFHE